MLPLCRYCPYFLDLTVNGRRDSTDRRAVQSSLLVCPGHQREVVNRPRWFQKRAQYFIRTHNETLSVIAVCIDSPDCSPLVIQSGYAAPTGLAEI